MVVTLHLVTRVTGNITIRASFIASEGKCSICDSWQIVTWEWGWRCGWYKFTNLNISIKIEKPKYLYCMSHQCSIHHFVNNGLQSCLHNRNYIGPAWKILLDFHQEVLLHCLSMGNFHRLQLFEHMNQQWSKYHLQGKI